MVDDNAAMRSRLTRTLGPLGDVISCAHGLEALDVMESHHVDLVVTDSMMPHLDGVGLLREIRSHPVHSQTPVVMLSARAGTEAATDALESGADDYVVKPFTREELVARCQSTLELSRARAAVTAERARAALLAGVSHDMQTPLSVIRSALDLLADFASDVEDPAGPVPGDDEMKAEILDRARARADQLDRLIRQCLDWSRLAAGVPISALLTTVDLPDLVEKVLVDHSGVTFTRPETTALVSCDQARTEQILHNLLTNSARARRSRTEVEIEAITSDSGTLTGYDVVVRDDGAGIVPRVLPHLFSPFSPSDELSGNGLGLHVSREAARAQGGDLVLERTGHTGSTFVLHLRRAAP